jgi:ABC-type lipoprotein export system ATPase subunit/ABC-type antimicrobial peptide transport system permease subunit
MIELKNIQKIYKSKKAKNTVALKDISIKFPEKGLVFILGKSGSGKSTLLNILGGLDKYDSGDLIINEKSTKNFSNKDYDAYRNTHIGFIFQDFNLLENYSIEKNISLSLELKNEKVDKSKISETLKIVGLDGFEKRKTNELSGGQKQRVAIARALIKNPNVILADEPTGNLDSVTGKQIFELLKELSKEKLVVIVSHDNENAQKYADRIIELRDGVIINDTDSNQDKLQNTEKFNLISAKLPFKYSLKMGLGNLIHKKFKLFFTILLTVFAVTCLGVMISATSFNPTEEHIKTLVKNNKYDISVVSFKEVFDGEKMAKEAISTLLSGGNGTLSADSIEITEEKIQEVKDKTGLNWSKQIVLTQNQTPASIIYANDATYSSIYYTESSMLEFVELDENNSKLIENKIIGRLPENSDEIVIPNYIADNIIQSGTTLYNSDKNAEKETYTPISYNQIINDEKMIEISGINKGVKVVGIIEYDMSQYQSLKTISNDDYYSGYTGVESLYVELHSNFKYVRVYVTDNFIQSLNLKDNNTLSTSLKINYNDKMYVAGQIAYISDKINVFDGNDIIELSELKDNNIVIDLSILNQITDNDFQKKYDEYLEKNYYSTENNIKDFIKNYIKDNGIIGKTVKTNIANNEIVKSIDNYEEYKISGVIIDDVSTPIVYFNKEKLNGIIQKNIYVDSIFTEVKNEQELRDLFSKYPMDKSDTILYSTYTNLLVYSLIFTVILNAVGKYGTIFFLVFAILLLVNFISSSITYRKKEIGILRAIGCKSKDILTMFIVESLSLVLISLVISNKLINFIVIKFNSTIGTYLNNEVSYLNYNLKQQIMIVIITLIIALIANIIPIRKITKMKPIDAILNK